MTKQSFSLEEAKDAAETAGINFEQAGFTAETLLQGMNVELEHGARDPETNVTEDDPVKTAKIAWAHLKESVKYYDYLDQMEKKMDSEVE